MASVQSTSSPSLQYIPVLPLSMAEVMGSPSTFIIGFPGPVESAQVYAADITLVDLDSNRVYIPATATSGSGSNLTRGLPRLPEAQRRKLEAALRRHAYGSMEAENATRWFGFSFGGGGGGSAPKSRYPAVGMYGANFNPELSRGGRLASLSHAFPAGGGAGAGAASEVPTAARLMTEMSPLGPLMASAAATAIVPADPFATAAGSASTAATPDATTAVATGGRVGGSSTFSFAAEASGGSSSSSALAARGRAAVQVAAPWDPPRQAVAAPQPTAAGTPLSTPTALAARPPPRHFCGSIDLRALAARGGAGISPQAAAVVLEDAASPLPALASGWAWPTHEEALAAAAAASSAASVAAGASAAGGGPPAPAPAPTPVVVPPLALPPLHSQPPSQQAAPPASARTGRPGMTREPGRRSLTSQTAADSPPSASASAPRSPPETVSSGGEGGPPPPPPPPVAPLHAAAVAPSQRQLQAPAAAPAPPLLVVGVQVDDDDGAPSSGAASAAAIAGGGAGGVVTPLLRGSFSSDAALMPAAGAGSMRPLAGTAAPPSHAATVGAGGPPVVLRAASIGSIPEGQVAPGAGGGPSSTPSAGAAAADDTLPTNPSTGLSDAFNAANIRGAFAQFFGGSAGTRGSLFFGALNLSAPHASPAVGIFKNYARCVGERVVLDIC